MSCQPTPIYKCPCLVLAKFMAMEGCELVTKWVFGLDLGDVQVYALLSNTYDVASKWDWSAKIGQQRGW
jgi:hypothetical protein